VARLRRYSNTGAETQLASGISIGDLSLTVDNASGYPEPPFTIEADNEVIEVGAKAGNVFSSLDRGFDGSLETAHTAGTDIRLVAVADDFKYRWQDVIVSRNYLSLDNEFDDDDDSDLTTVTPTGVANWTEANGVLSCAFYSQSSSDLCGRATTISTIGTGTAAQTAVRLLSTDNYGFAGVYFSSGSTTTDSVVFVGIYHAPDDGDGKFYLTCRSGTFTALTTSHYNDQSSLSGGWVHVRLLWVSINTFRPFWSPDGVSWSSFGASNYTISGINPPTRMGCGVSSWGSSGTKLATFEYLRIWEP
jgi:hypothetical protein